MNPRSAIPLFAWVLLLIVVITPPAAIAQDEANTKDAKAQPAEPEPKPVEKSDVIPAADVVSYAAGAMTRLGTILEGSSSGALIAGVEGDLPNVIAEIDSLVARRTSDAPDEFSMRDLEIDRQDWVRQRAKLEAWIDDVDEQSQLLQGNVKEVESLKVVWNRTRRDSTAEHLPEVVIHQVDSVLAEIEKADSLVRGEMERVLTLEARLSSQAGRTNENIQRIDDEIANRRGKLFGFEERPLWHPARRPANMSVTDELRESWGITLRSLQHFWQDYQQRLLLHLVVIALVTLLLIAVRVSSRAWESDDMAVQLAKRLFSRPLSAAIVICLLPLQRIYPNGPIVAYEVADLLILPALAILLPCVFPRGLLPPLYAMFLLFAMNQTRELIGTSMYRYNYLIVMIGFIVTASWYLRAQRSLMQDKASQAVASILKSAVVIAIVALGANILGAVSLADILVYGILTSIYLGVLAYVAIRLIDGLIVAFLHSRSAQSLRMVIRHKNLLQRRAVGTVHFLLGTAWVTATLRQFQVFDPIVSGFRALFDQTWSIGSFSISGGSFILFFVILWVSTQISRFVRFVLQEDILTRTKLPRGVPSTVSMLVNYAIIAAGLLIALAAAGIQLSQFSILIGALGVGVGFGLQTLVNNFVSGLILMFERPIQVGDTIEVGTLLGSVRRIGIRASVVRTFDGAEVIVPNGDLLSGQVVNWTLSDFLRRIEVKVGVAYGTDPDRVIDILLREADAHEKAIKSPEPYALFLGFGDSSLDFLVRFWTGDSENWLITKSDVTVAINRALIKAGIEIPFPQRDLHVRSVAPSVKGLPGVEEETPEKHRVRETASQPDYRQKPIRRSQRTGGDIESGDDGD